MITASCVLCRPTAATASLTRSALWRRCTGGGLEVVPLPVDLNYFVLLEEEVLEAAQSGKIPPPTPHLAHFMADASLELLLPEQLLGDGEDMTDSSASSSSCSCRLHRDEPFPSSSLIVAMVSERCSALCQLHRPYNLTSRGEREYHATGEGRNELEGSESLSLIEDSLDVPREKLRVLWPVQGAMLFSQLNKVIVDIIVILSPEAAEVAPLNLAFDLFVTFKLLSQHSECSVSPDTCETSLQIEGVLPISRRRDLRIGVTMTVSLKYQDGEPPVQQVVMLQVVSPHLLPTSYTGFNNVHQRSPLPYSLSSQLQLAHLLNTRSLHSMGVVLCCDTDVGLQTAVHLIRRWGHRIEVDRRLHGGGLGDDRLLLIVVQGNHPRGTAALAAELVQQCDSRHVDRKQSGLGKEHQLGCVIIQDSSVINIVRENIINNRVRSLSFVYTDVFSNHASYAASLQQWFPALRPGGVMVGSRYHLPTLSAHSPWRKEGVAVQVRSAVDACAFNWSVPVFVTYFEAGLQRGEEWMDIFQDNPGAEEGGQLSSAWGVYAAWYVFNNARSP